MCSARLTSTAQRWLVARDWKGNVRELRSAVECAQALTPPPATGSLIDVADLRFAVGEHAEDIPSIQNEHGALTLDQEVAALERLRIVEALERTTRNHTQAAGDLGLSRVGLLKRWITWGYASEQPPHRRQLASGWWAAIHLPNTSWRLRASTTGASSLPSDHGTRNYLRPPKPTSETGTRQASLERPELGRRRRSLSYPSANLSREFISPEPVLWPG
jgi:hypothetical protein